MLRRKREFIQALVCISLLFVAPILVSAPALKHGGVPMDLDGLTTRAPWQEARPSNLENVDQEAFMPVIDRYYPWQAFLSHAAANRELPLWNPYEGFGVPFLALWRSRVLSPFSLPLYSGLPVNSAICVSVFLKLLIAGLCAYYAARRFHFTPPYALLVAITYQASGMLLSGHWHPASDVLPWLPLMLPCLQRLLLGEYRVWPYLALLIGVCALGGDPETLVAIVLFVLVLTVSYGFRTYTHRHLVPSLAVLFATIVVGLLSAGIQWAPYLEFLRHGTLEGEAGIPFGLSQLTMLLAPSPPTNMVDGSLWLPAGMVGFFLLPLWFAVRPFANRIRRRRLEAFLIATGVLLLFSFVAAPLLRRISGLSMLDVRHFAAPYPLALGLLAATAADEWVHLDADRCKAALKKIAVLLPLLWGIHIAATALAVYGTTVPASSGNLWLSVVAALVIFLLLVITAINPRPVAMAYALTLLTALTAWSLYMPHRHITPDEQVFPETQFIRALHQQDSRVGGSMRLQRWPLAAHAIPQTYSPSGITLTRSHRFMQQAEATPELLRLANAKALLLTKEDVQGGFSALRPTLNIQEVFPSGAILLTDLQAHERARVSHAGRDFESGTPEEQLVRPAGPPLLEGGQLPESIMESPSASAVITHDGYNEVRVAASTSRPGVLVLADAWYPGWQVTVNASPEKLFPVDIAFRGVEISGDENEIVFRYAPASLTAGAVCTLVGFLATVFGLVSLLRRR